MENLQKDLLAFIRDYNDGKINVKNTDNKIVKSKIFKNGVASKECIGIWLEGEFVTRLKYSKEEVEENLKLLAEDGKIKAIPEDGSYLNTKEPISLTSKGYDELSFFKRHPIFTGLAIIATVLTTVATIIMAIFSVLTFYYK
jgi:hypothetical protein